MSDLKKLRRQLWLFGLFKIPMIGFVRPRLKSLSEREIGIAIRVNRRNRNHLKSLYIGAITIGADLAAGFLAFKKLNDHKLKFSLAFKSMSAAYHQRITSEALFVCKEGEVIDRLIERCQNDKQRHNEKINVLVYEYDELKAEVEMELSIKIL